VIRGILLAAGASRRFGGNKLLHPLPGGLTIGEQAAKHLLEGAGNALAVVRPGDDELARRLEKLGCEILVAPGAMVGMGGSLASAVAATSGAEAWVVALADMPFVTAETIRAVAAALRRGAAISVPVLRGENTRGHPVGFQARFGATLANLSGDQGARAVLDLHAAEIVEVEVRDDGIYRDVDTPVELP
jgi:molybdenum cofactor cytidylyltransferase